MAPEAIGCNTARRGDTSKVCKWCWPMAPSIEVGREPWPLNGNGHASSGGTRTPAELLDTRRRDLLTRLRELLWRESTLIAQHQPRSLLNRCGYQLADVLGESYLDVPRLLCGSEGTLALITEATLATQPLPRHRGVAMLLFDRLESAAQAVPEILAFKPGACDLLDRRHLSLARETSPEFEVLIPADTEALLLVEYAGDDAATVRNKVAQTIDRICRKKQLAFQSRQALDPADVNTFWQLAVRVVPTLHRLRGTSRPMPIVEDVAVSPDSLPDFLLRMQNALKRHQITASLYGHVGHGQLHIRPFLDLSDPEDVRKMSALADDLYAEVFQLGGTISGEHGDGLSRTPFVRQQYGPLYDVFRQVKALFDPQNILNPGKIVADAPQSIIDNLRPLRQTGDTPPTLSEMPIAETFATLPTATPASVPVALHLNWNQAELNQAAERCNGCGACRSQLPDVRMCPIFRVAPLEEASPRAKANLLRAVFEGQLDPNSVALDEFKDIADLCVNCHQCRLECPASVDIPKLMIEAKAMYVDANGLRPSDWLLGRFDRLSALGSALAPLSNWALHNRVARWVLEKTLGIAQGRKLPRFAPRSFMRRAVRRRLTRPTRRSGRKVLYFVDTYANYHDPQLADALVAVMEHNGVAVYVHPDQKPSGMGLITMGSLAPARRLAAHNIHLLAEAVRQGYHIVATEPSTVLCLTHEYLNLHRRRRRPHRRRQYQRSLLLSLADASPRQTATQSATAQHRARLSSAMPHSRAGDRLAGRKSIAADPRPRPAARRTRLLRHGRPVGSQARKLPHQPPRRLERDHATPRSGTASRRHRMQRLQNSDGARRHQAHDPSAQTAGPVLRPDARTGRPAFRPHRRVGGHMKLQVRLFAVVRGWAGQDAVELDLPAAATVTDVRRAMLTRLPQLSQFGPQLRFSVNAQYADDATPIPAGAEVACIPPPSGG